MAGTLDETISKYEQEKLDTSAAYASPWVSTAHNNTPKCTPAGALRILHRNWGMSRRFERKSLGDAAFVERHACATTDEGMGTVHHFRALTWHAAVSTYRQSRFSAFIQNRRA